MKSLPCPGCGEVLGGSSKGVLTCRACLGVFVTQPMIASMLRDMRAGRVPMTPLGGNPYRSSAATVTPQVPVEQQRLLYIACPTCGEIMNRTRLGGREGIVVDVCLAHGIWFDPGEIETAAALLGKTNMDLSTQVGELLALFLKR